MNVKMAEHDVKTVNLADLKTGDLFKMRGVANVYIKTDSGDGFDLTSGCFCTYFSSPIIPLEIVRELVVRCKFNEES